MPTQGWLIDDYLVWHIASWLVLYLMCIGCYCFLCPQPFSHVTNTVHILRAKLSCPVCTKRHYLLVFTVGLLPSLAISADWDSCVDDLDRLRRATRDAIDAANAVKSTAHELENCKQYPDIFDLMRDRCQSKTIEYRVALNALKNMMTSVEKRIRSVSSSCGVGLSSVGGSPYARPGSPSAGDPKCDLYRSYRNKLPLEKLMNVCTQSISETECRKCLGQ